MSDDRARLLEKVNKLLALAEGKASIEESAAAAAKAQELIERYKIDQAELESAGGPAETLGQLNICRISPFGRGLVRWELAAELAPLFDCFAFALAGDGDDWAVVAGQRTDCELLQRMFAFCEKAIDGETRKADLRVYGRNADFSFRSGMATRLVERIAIAREGLRSGASAGALVSLGNRAKEAESRVRSELGLSDPVEVAFKVDPAAAFLGRMAGDRVELTPKLKEARA